MPETSTTTDYGTLVQCLRNITYNDKTTYRHHEARPYDGKTAKDVSGPGTIFNTPREIAEGLLNRLGEQPGKERSLFLMDASAINQISAIAYDTSMTKGAMIDEIRSILDVFEPMIPGLADRKAHWAKAVSTPSGEFAEVRLDRA